MTSKATSDSDLEFDYLTSITYVPMSLLPLNVIIWQFCILSGQ